MKLVCWMKAAYVLHEVTHGRARYPADLRTDVLNACVDFFANDKTDLDLCYRHRFSQRRINAIEDRLNKDDVNAWERFWRCCVDLKRLNSLLKAESASPRQSDASSQGQR